MLLEQTVRTLKSLRLPGMAAAFEEQHTSAATSALSFDERFALLVDREQTWRDNRRVTRLLTQAKLKSSQACVEDVRYGSGRGLDKSLMAQLASCQWIRGHQNLVITGATGCGKTWLSCALGNVACRQGLSVAYTRMPRLFDELRIAHGDGSFGKRLAALAKTDLLILDDWVAARSTIITSQLPVEHWHAYLNDPTLADAILDRILHAAHKMAISGESLRKTEKGST
jgi:DNA replication protein DnaC